VYRLRGLWRTSGMVKYNFGEYSFGWDNYLDDNMRLILDKAIPNKWDCLGIVFGKEGAGKTTLGSQLAMFCNNHFNLDFTVFTPEQFLETTDNCPEESSILWDEAITGASAQRQGFELSQAIISRLTTIRRKRLKIFICFPYLHMLNKYFVSRCLFSIYVYAKGFDKRGFMNYYNQRKTEVLYELMKNKYTYNPLAALRKIRPSFYCRYPNKLCLPEEEYNTKKEFCTRSDKPDKKEEKYRWRLAKLCLHLSKEKIVFIKDIAPLIGVTPQIISKLIKDYTNNDVSDSE
jgi:hypothetical protein